MHTETCRDLKFWEKFLDMMVENRFNVLSLWNRIPFHYMIRPKNYPSACPFSDEELQKWQKLFHGIFQMAKDRGIETYIVNWNIFLPRSFAKENNLIWYNPKHKHATQGDTSKIVKDYTRECVTQVINEFPNLTGLGFSLGERMGQMIPEEREKWVIDTFVEGIRNADRKVKLIHRLPFTSNNNWGGALTYEMEDMTRNYIDKIDCVEGPVWVEIKFNWSHDHSTPKLIKTHGGKLHDRYWNPKPQNHKICWTVRNEDFFCLRWGDTDFIREHVKNNVHDYVGGYFIGSETYIPAKDYFTKINPVDWEYAFERQWLFYKTWGRLLYNPQTPDKIFKNEFTYKYGDEYRNLFDAYSLVSQVPLLVNSFFDISWDFTFYAEVLMFAENGPKTKFININSLINQLQSSIYG